MIVQDTFRTDTVKLDTIRDIKPVKSVIDLPYTSWEIAAICLAIAILSVLLIVIFRRQITTRMQAFSTPKSPLQEAEEVLKNLAEEFKPGEDEDQRRYAEALSSVLRTYLSDRFKISGHYLTRRQLMDEPHLKTKLDAEALAPLHDILVKLDRVKFSSGDNQQVMPSASKLLALVRDIDSSYLKDAADD